MKIQFTVAYFVVILICVSFLGYAIWYVSKIFIVLFRGSQERRDARLMRQSKIEQMETHELRSSFLNHNYFVGLKDTHIVRDLLTKVNERREEDFLKSLNESRFHRLLVSAEHVAGRQGRPEAVDYSSEIWDMLIELSRRGRTNEIV